MRIRKVKTITGKTAVQVASYTKNKTFIHKHIGSTNNKDVLKVLEESALKWIEDNTGQASLFSAQRPSKVRINETIVGKYKYLGFRYNLMYETISAVLEKFGLTTPPLTQECDEKSQATWKMFLDLALMRTIEPASKRASQELLVSLFGINYSLTAIYRNMNIFCGFKDAVESKLMDFAKTSLGFDFSFVLYDITTLYFETFTEDSFRKRGYSKDNKVGQPQILVGLIVSKEGFPLSFAVFEGSKFEGHTMIPVIRDFKTKHNISRLTVVADAGMLSNKNIEAVKSAGFDYIVGARLGGKNISDKLALDIKTKLNGVDGATTRVLTKEDTLVCSFSSSRYKKDLYEHNKQLEKARLIVAGKKAVKSSRFVTNHQKGRGELNQALVDRAEILLGIKGYRTNLDIPNNIIIQRYSDLWQVEKAFRISKHDLEARPIYHFTKGPVVAHVLICMLALAVLKFMEIRTGSSPKYVIDQLKSVTDGLMLNTLTDKVEEFRAEINRDVQNLLNKLID